MALADLALQRAENTKIAVLENNDDLQDRINIMGVRSLTKKSDEMIKIKVSLSAGEMGKVVKSD
jgi:hypothetical protein